jgi:hypothetical protein
MADQQWRSDELLAWTERDGPGRGPRGPQRRAWLLVAGTLSVVFMGLMSSESLCPEHRLWVLLLGGASFIAAGTAIVGLLDGWAGAPLLTLVSALGGVGVGLIDTIHAPTRGRLTALGFAVVFVGAACLVIRQERQLRWDRRVSASLRPLPVDASAVVASTAPAEPANVPARPRG